jgi:DNA-binding transcriptional LysR family regulator
VGEVPPFSLKRARYFVVLAEELHFGRAAARLYMAQPGLSQQIKALEVEMGVRLVDRRGRDTHLTPAGELLYREATRLLADADDVVHRVQARAAGRTGRLQVGYSRSATYLGSPEVVQEFRSHHPDVQVSTTVAWTAFNIEMLRSHRVDVAFVRAPVDEPDIATLLLLTEEHVLALPPGHRLIDQPVIVPADVADEDVVAWPRTNGPGHYDRLVSQIWGADRPRVVVTEPDDDQILMAVANGLGVAIVEHQRALHIHPEQVTLRRFAQPAPLCGLLLAWRRDEHAPNVEAFIEICRRRFPSPQPVP